MIELYRTTDSRDSDQIETALKELVLAHRVILVRPEEPPAGLPAGTPLPALVDDGQIITGAENLKNHFEWLEKVTYAWHTFQGDACYVVSDDGTCL